MTFAPPVRLIIEINSKLALLLGSILNGMLFWLVWKKTPKEMRMYSKIVLQTCVCDMVNLMIADLVQPILLVSSGTAFVVNCGVAGALQYPFGAASFYVWITFAHFVTMGIAVQFAYRYMILCKNMAISSTVYFLMLFTVILFEALFFAYLAHISFAPPGAVVEDKYVLGLLGHANGTGMYYIDENDQRVVPSYLRLAVRGDTMDPRWIIWHFFFVAIPVCCYLFVVATGSRMYKLCKRNMDILLSMPENAKMAQLNYQLTMNLLIQASIPLLAMCCWCLCTYACVFGYTSKLEWFNALSALTATPSQCWISVFNPLVTILTVMPYRRALRRKLHLGRVEPSSSQAAAAGPAAAATSQITSGRMDNYYHFHW